MRESLPASEAHDCYPPLSEANGAPHLVGLSLYSILCLRFHARLPLHVLGCIAASVLQRFDVVDDVASGGACALSRSPRRRTKRYQSRIARSCSEVSACQAAATAPSCQSGSEYGAVAADPISSRFSTFDNCARCAGGAVA